MNEDKVRASEIDYSRALLAEVSAIFTKNFSEADDKITSDITGKMLEMTKAGLFGTSNKNAKFFHLGVACLTLARGFSEKEMLATA
jgi:hypothetical protein